MEEKMNPRKLFQSSLYVLAIVLTLALALPAITAAQGNDWIPDGKNIYYEGGNVGIGSKPANPQIQLQVFNNDGHTWMMLSSKNDHTSGIHFRENSNMRWGYSLLYNGAVKDPFGGPRDSGMFGIWRYINGKWATEPVLSAYRHSNNVGIGRLPSERADVRLAVAGHTIVQSPSGWVDGSVARLYLGDYGHWIQSKWGTGIQISPSRAPNAITIQEVTGFVGIGTPPSDRPDVRLALNGHQIIQGPGDWVDGSVARLYLGDYSHWIQSKWGTGIQIKPSQSDIALTVQEKSGFVGIGTAEPRALLEISGPSGISGVHLSLKEDASSPPGHNSPMVKWDSTSFHGVEKIWFARAQGNNWVLNTSNPDYSNATTIIRVSPDGEVCLGTGCE
jgi:hypothetical protein